MIDMTGRRKTSKTSQMVQFEDADTDALNTLLRSVRNPNLPVDLYHVVAWEMWDGSHRGYVMGQWCVDEDGNRYNKLVKGTTTLDAMKEFIHTLEAE